MKTTQHTPYKAHYAYELEGSSDSVQSGHTPGKWTIKNPDGNDVLIYGDGNIVPHDGRTSPVAVCYGVDRKANAKFIVTACNAHYELLEACRMALADESTSSKVAKVCYAAIANAGALTPISAQGKE